MVGNRKHTYFFVWYYSRLTIKILHCFIFINLPDAVLESALGQWHFGNEILKLFLHKGSILLIWFHTVFQTTAIPTAVETAAGMFDPSSSIFKNVLLFCSVALLLFIVSGLAWEGIDGLSTKRFTQQVKYFYKLGHGIKIAICCFKDNIWIDKPPWQGRPVARISRGGCIPQEPGPNIYVRTIYVGRASSEGGVRGHAPPESIWNWRSRNFLKCNWNGWSYHHHVIMYHF